MSVCNILIIEGDVDNVEFISEALKSIKDIHIHHVYTTKQAYQYLEGLTADSLPQLVVADMYLLDSMGAAFLSDLQAHETYKGIKAVILSSSNRDYALKKFPQLVVDYWQKPYDKEGYTKIAEQIRVKLKDCLSAP